MLQFKLDPTDIYIGLWEYVPFSYLLLFHFSFILSYFILSISLFYFIFLLNVIVDQQLNLTCSASGL